MYDVKNVITAVIIVILILWPLLCVFNIVHGKLMYFCYLFVCINFSLRMEIYYWNILDGLCLWMTYNNIDIMGIFIYF